MEITEKNIEKCMIISIQGRLDTISSAVFEKRLTELMDNQVTRIIVNCSQMDFISSSGLRTLLFALKRITKTNGKLVICGLSENFHEIFAISGFTQIFEIYPSEEEALSVF